MKMLRDVMIGGLMLSAMWGGGKNVADDSGAEAADHAEMSTPRAVVTEQAMRERIKILSSDTYDGRAPATPGGAMTRKYLVGQMKAIGLQPANGDSFEQDVSLVEVTLQPEQSSLTINGEALAYKEQAVWGTKRVEKEVSYADSEMVFVGYGIVAPEYGWNDYDGVDVRGKTVLMLINDPGFATQDEDLFNGNAMTYYGRWTYKFEEAARQGAAGALIIHQTAPAAYGWGVVDGGWSGPQLDLVREDNGASFAKLEGWVQESVGKDLFAKAGLDFDALTKAAHVQGFKPVPMPNISVSATMVNETRLSSSANVAGILPGKTHPDEYILYMAHWDHMGNIPQEDGSDGIFNGAIDNATGTAGVLAIAEAMAVSEPLDRSVLFLAVTAEESGLLGSAYFGENPLVPLSQIVGGINMDAILPTPEAKDMVVVGFGASELEEYLAAAAKEKEIYLRPDPQPEKGYFYRSDHISLAKKGVPMLYADGGVDLRDGGEAAGLGYADDYTANRYHKPADEYSEDWEMGGIIQTLNLFRETGAALATTEDWPNWYEGNEFRALRDSQRAAQ